jgi:SAM-dependent methyltransferase
MIYDYPQYYEAAFSFRDIPREAAFLGFAMERFSSVKVKRVLEVACGFAPHAGALTEQGYRYVGLDNNRNMLDYATYKWHGLKPPPEFVQADMVKFELPGSVDFAYVMLGSLYLNSLEEMTSHFDSMARALRPGGLYFLDWCVQFSDPLASAANNAFVNERDGIRVESKFNIRLVDPARQMYEEVWTLNIVDNGRHKRFELIERNRAIFPQEFLLFVESRTDFEMVGWWKDWDFNKPIEGSVEVDRPIALLRRV